MLFSEARQKAAECDAFLPVASDNHQILPASSHPPGLIDSVTVLGAKKVHIGTKERGQVGLSGLSDWLGLICPSTPALSSVVSPKVTHYCTCFSNAVM